MSRLNTMSAAAIAALFKPESTDTLITLLTVYDPTDDTTVVLRIADNFTQRITANNPGDISGQPVTNDIDVVYGVPSNGHNFIFVPMGITLPSEENNTASRASIVLTDITKYATPIIRQIMTPPRVKLEIVLSSTPDIIEASFDKFYLSSFTYNADQITADLSMIDYAVEPFPAYSFTPAYFPGLF